MTKRSRWITALGLAGLFVTSTGCSDSLNAGPLAYIDNDALTHELAGKANLAGKPALQDKVRAALILLYGHSPQRIRVPENSGFRDGGLVLANLKKVGEGESARVERIYHTLPDGRPDPSRPQIGGYALYRRNCLHCHGVSGAGDGPTSAFLFPPPRDFRKGLFKFTSTPSGARPHRDDLTRSIRDGLMGTSMPAFEALMSPSEIAQVVEYVIFLAVRGETELALIEEGSIADETDAEALGDDVVKELSIGVLEKWKSAQSQVMNPAIPRTPSNPESVHRGRDLYLGRTKEKLECAGCHGALAKGDGPSFVPIDVYNMVVFGGEPGTRQARVDALDDKLKTLWKQKADDWGNPLRPANLNQAVYKGGRRPIDLFWRIAKGINGAQMPAHYPTLNEAQIWDLVNFVLALPYDPDLLASAPPAPPPKLAESNAP